MNGEELCDWEPRFNDRGFYLAIGGGATLQNKAHALREIRRMGWQVDLHDYTDKMCVLSLQGPYSRSILEDLTDTDLSNEEFPFSSHKVFTIAGQQARAMRISFVGELGELAMSSNLQK